MSDRSNTTKLFIGGPIDHASERKFLECIIPWLNKQGVPAIILANIEIDGRQVDCVIATENSVSVVEVKTTRLPLKGELNGPWTRLAASGEWQTYANAYQQAVAAKNRVRDAMQAIKPAGEYYPDGYVVFTRALPEGSEVTSGNFKARVTTMDRFPSELKTEGNSPWSLIDWEAFARKLNLTSVSLDQVIADARAHRTSDALERYNKAVASEYAPEGDHWLPETDQQAEQLLAAAKVDAGCHISGPSGCGKTLMAKWLAAKLAADGHPVFFVAAKDFSGSWADTLHKEIELLADGVSKHLYRAISQSDRSVFLIVDGVNEFGAAAPEALRGVRALSRRLSARLILTSQDAKPEEYAGLNSVTISRPDLKLKQRIAEAADPNLSPVAQEILRAVGSGIEAELVGQIGSGLKADATRLILIDQYVRKRLGAHARFGSFALRRLASTLHSRVAYSMTEMRFDEFMRAEGVSFETCDALFATGLLVKRASRVSFFHEMILNACAALELASDAATDASSFGQRLSTPILEPIAGDIIAAIDDAKTCQSVLAEATKSTLLVEAASGRLGTIAAASARKLLEETSEACIAEIRDARLSLSKKDDVVHLAWEDGTRREWTYAEKARLGALGRLAIMGPGIDTFLNLCAEMDARLLAERRRWADFARQEEFPIRSQSFSLAYYGFGEKLGFTTIALAAQRFFEPMSREEKRYPVPLAEMTSGQLHFFLEGRRRFSDGDGGQFAEDLIYLFRERFRFEPYHVQLSMLHSVGFARSAPRKTLDQLIEAIEALEIHPANWGINTSVIDALKMLGALDSEGEDARAEIKAEIESALTDDDDAVDLNLALSVYTRMFDHPFDTIYAEEVFDLAENRRRHLYRRALQAPDIKRSSSLKWLIKEVASFGDPDDAYILQSFSNLPSKTNPFVQDEWAAFVISTRFLGRHHAKLDEIDHKRPEEACLLEIRSLVYALEAKREIDAENAQMAWRRLHGMTPQLVAGCLSEVQEALAERPFPTDENEPFPPLDLAAAYPEGCLAVARRFIDEGIDGKFYHRVPCKEKAISFAFDTVAAKGDRSDISRLRDKSRAHPFARYALAALKQLDAGAPL